MAAAHDTHIPQPAIDPTTGSGHTHSHNSLHPRAAAAPSTFGDGQTLLQWSRAVDTCDQQDLPVETGATRVLWAYNDEKPTDSSPPKRHTKKGSTAVRMFAPGHDAPLPADAETFDMRSNNFTIPFLPVDPVTMYYCMAVKLPADGKKRHIVKWEPIADPPENIDVLHHFLVYECAALNSSYVGMHGPCFDGSLPQEVQQCLQGGVMAAWAVGGHAFDYPEDVGYPIGPGFPEYAVIEIHYNNPTQRKIVDSSGVRFTMTETLRTHEAGMLQTGMFTDPVLTIPAKTSKTVYEGWCPGSCTSKAMPADGINVVATLLHAHTSAVKIDLLHGRNGTELKPILLEPTYDFNFQDFERHEPYLKLMPGDTLMTRCTFDTSARDHVTTFGLSTQQEMCLSFLLYYPRMQKTAYCMYGNLTGLIPELPGPQVISSCFNEPISRNNFETSFVTPYVPPTCTRVPPAVDRQTPRGFITANLSAYERSEILDPDGKFQLFWTVNTTSQQISFAALVNTTGWIGLGFSPNGGMVGSDIMMAWLSGADGHQGTNIADRMALEYALPSTDSLQDLYDITAVQFPVGLPSAPVLVSTQVGNGSVSLSYQFVNDGGLAIQQIEVEYQSAADGNAAKRMISFDLPSKAVPFVSTITVPALVNGQGYQFTAKASSSAGSATAATTPVIIPAATPEVAMLAVKTNGSFTATLRWQVSVDGGAAHPPSEYVIQWGLATMNGSEWYWKNQMNAPANATITTPVSNTTAGVCVWDVEFRVWGLQQNVEIYFRVAAINAAGKSAWSNSAKAKPIYPDSDGGLSVWYVIGPCIGAAALGLVAYMCWRRRQSDDGGRHQRLTDTAGSAYQSA